MTPEQIHNRITDLANQQHDIANRCVGVLSVLPDAPRYARDLVTQWEQAQVEIVRLRADLRESVS